MVQSFGQSWAIKYTCLALVIVHIRICPIQWRARSSVLLSWLPGLCLERAQESVGKGDVASHTCSPSRQTRLRSPSHVKHTQTHTQAHTQACTHLEIDQIWLLAGKGHDYCTRLHLTYHEQGWLARVICNQLNGMPASDVGSLLSQPPPPPPRSL